jgi:hypothetical protein
MAKKTKQTKKVATEKVYAWEEMHPRDKLHDALVVAKPALFLPQSESNGLGKFSLSPKLFEELKNLHEAIASAVEGFPWGEVDAEQDSRRRMYAFLPEKLQEFEKSGIHLGPTDENTTDVHERVIQMATVILDFDFRETNETAYCQQNRTLFCSFSQRKALDSITKQIQGLVSEKYKEFVTFENLIALQPNLHNSATYLAPHLDFPRCDGFGVIIATVGMEGSGTILLIDDGNSLQDKFQSWSFRLSRGECYFLSGDARNKCSHGVLCEEGMGDTQQPRASLNLRYGLHTKAFAQEEVDIHWG